MAADDLVKETQISSLITAIANTINSKISGLAATYTKKDLSAATTNVEGFWQRLNLTTYSTNGTDLEPLMVNGFRSSAARRAFWVNENGSPRGASVNDEPAMKLFGPAANVTYSGLLFQILTRWNGASDTQRHIYGVHTDGRLRIGTNQTPASAVVVLTAAAAVPAGLPVGTVILRTP